MDSIFRFAGARSFCALILPLLCGAVSAHPEDFDIVVYGGTSGGITAAVQAAKMGKKVALVSPTKHLGGLSSSGLGYTDLGDIAILGGLSREFYHRVYLHYQQTSSWNLQSSAFTTMSAQGGGRAFNPTYETGSSFEPKIAEKIFNDLLTENKVPVFTGLLDLNDGVVMTGQRITALKMEDGRMFRGKMFIDAGYEGDVLAGAKVSFTIGREANSVHGETISGVQSNSSGNQVIDNISPYVVKGNAASGLLPGIEASIKADGTGDEKLQAYCFRMCLTSLASNRVAVPKPPGYNEADYEYVLRAVEAGQTNFFKIDAMPNRKTDSNNTGGISTDFIGKNYGVKNGVAWNWATLNHAERAALAKDHENWQRGLIWTLQNHSRVLAKVPGGIASTWGLPADEFTDNGNWPHQLYVREARRMVSDYVMTQKNCIRTAVATDSVGMAAYTMDSHHVQRYVKNGMLKNEGDVQKGTSGPYPVSYRSIIPKVGQCENLLVPWCLSSSHMAFGSIRMEPVFMTLGQSAATAAAIAINDGTSVQQVPYEKLAVKLRADGQALKLGTDSADVAGIVVDNNDPGATIIGDWTPSTATAGYNGADYLTDGNTGKGTKSVRFTPQIPVAGMYEVTLRWTALANRASNVPVKIYHRDGVALRTVNQETNGGMWFSLGTFYFEAGTSGSLLLETTDSNEYVIADAAQWTPPDASGVVELLSYIPSIVRGGSSPGELIFSRKGNTSAELVVNYTTSGSAMAGEISPALSGTFTIPAGARESSLSLVALKGAVPVGTKTVRVDLAAGSGYLVGLNAGVTITLEDAPFEAWRFANFTASQLADATISGANADPDGDGMSNLLEFFTGGNGQSGDAPPATSVTVQGGKLFFNVRRHEAAADLEMKVWESDDLVGWTRTPELILPTALTRDGVFQNLSIPIRASNPLGEGRRFFQLRIEK